MVPQESAQVKRVHIRWSEMLEDMSTREDYEALQQTLPHVPAWGQVIFQGLGNVITVTQSMQ
jgi:hypothetical protein